VKRLHRIEIIAFRRRTIAVGGQERSTGACADREEEVQLALAELSAAQSAVAKDDAGSQVYNERSSSDSRLTKIARLALGRMGTTLDIRRHARSKIYGGHDEHE
jgi:hypothetical protein